MAIFVVKGEFNKDCMMIPSEGGHVDHHTNHETDHHIFSDER